MPDIQKTSPTPSRRVNFRKGIIFSLLAAFGLFLAALILTGETWRAVAYAMVALFAFLFTLALYFWGAMLFGGILEFYGHRKKPVPWSIGESSPLEAPEHDIDPGLELLAAGMLVYRVGEVKPCIHFRTVPLTHTRAIRPFVVARTGAERAYQFDFVLTDEQDVTRFGDQFAHDLTDAPQMVMPPYRLSLSMPKKLIGQRWKLQVRSGVTVVTSFRFMFVDGVEQSGAAPRDQTDNDVEEPILDWQRELLPRLLDEVIKQDAMTSTQEIVLEDL